jgi:hypothetical protein
VPLYTYILTFKGSSYVTQDRRSNLRGFFSHLVDDLPASALPEMNSTLRKELMQKTSLASFSEVPNRKHVWRNSLEIGGSEFLIYAIQTEK